jgi:hypothetical protein
MYGSFLARRKNVRLATYFINPLTINLSWHYKILLEQAAFVVKLYAFDKVCFVDRTADSD